jgi:excisionase family DNA binding protein
MENEFLTLPETAKFLKLSIHTIYKMAEQKRIPAFKAGACWRFSKKELIEWMRENALKKPKYKRKK